MILNKNKLIKYFKNNEKIFYIRKINKKLEKNINLLFILK